MTGLKSFVSIFCFIQVILFSTAGWANSYPESAAAGIADGPGIWVNLWNYPQGDVDSYCATLRNNGVHNLFVQTSRSNTEAIAHPNDLGLLIESAHKHKINVIAWSYATLINPNSDASRLTQAANFKSIHGQSIDGIAADLEENLTSWRVESFCQKLKQTLGNNYPIIAVVYSPLNRAQQAANTPWKVLVKYFDIIAPMTYWAGKSQTLDAYTYTTLTIRNIRTLTGRSDVEIHPIGDGIKSSNNDIESFLKACKDSEASSASLYPNQKVTASQLAVLSRYGNYFEDNSRFRLAAYRELIKSGDLKEPEKADPSQYINRGQLYQLIVHRLYAAQNAETPALAYQTLYDLGLAEESPSSASLASFLSSPVPANEAISLIANLVDMQSNPKELQKSRHRSDNWFVQSAKAAEPISSNHAKTHSINYLDAAQMVLQARGSLHAGSNHNN